LIVCDTGPLVAAALTGDVDHARCVRLFDSLHVARRPVVIPGTVVAEAGYLIGRELGPRGEVAFLRSIGGGAFAPGNLAPADFARAAELAETYADLPLGTTDATVIALAERLNVREVATLDRRHFTVVRPQHVDALTLLPD
jgi:predicted nucleic acid-binding protein